MSFPFHDLYSFLRGPGIVISAALSAAVLAYRTLALVRATKIVRVNGQVDAGAFSPPASSAKKGLYSGLKYLFRVRFKGTLPGSNPVMSLVSIVFHLLLFITPVFLTAHNVIADTVTGYSLCSFPERVTDTFTLLLIITGGFFLARRLFVPRVRIISTVRDFAVLFLVMAPFVSAYFAYHNIFSYRLMVYIHMITGEAALIALPFTNLVHMPFIFFSRFFIGSEHSIACARRAWKQL